MVMIFEVEAGSNKITMKFFVSFFSRVLSDKSYITVSMLHSIKSQRYLRVNFEWSFFFFFFLFRWKAMEIYRKFYRDFGIERGRDKSRKSSVVKKKRRWNVKLQISRPFHSFLWRTKNIPLVIGIKIRGKFEERDANSRCNAKPIFAHRIRRIHQVWLTHTHTHTRMREMDVSTPLMNISFSLFLYILEIALISCPKISSSPWRT